MLCSKPLIAGIICCVASVLQAHSQQITRYNLVELLKENRLDTLASHQAQLLGGSTKQAISAIGIVWLKDVNFKDGIIDVDLRGKDVFLKSFLGIIFHAKDTTNYDLIYFRPFRFRSTDTPTRKWSVQYVCMPRYDWKTLRESHPRVYENEVNPVPRPDDWFHATITVKKGAITVYVNHSTIPSLKVRSLNNIAAGKIGLWADGLSGDFAGLAITK